VPRVEFACGRVGDDGDLTAAQPDRAALRLLPGLAAGAGRQLVYLHGMGNRSPTRRGRGVHATGSRHVVWLAPKSEAEAARANVQLVVRGRELSCEVEIRRRGVPLVGNWSEKLPTSREQFVLPVMVLIEVLSVTSLKLLDCKNGGFQKLAMNLCAHEIK
jgi:hypothetical protein